jgi:protocatechuate 3,4-dioxygenase beta subunit
VAAATREIDLGMPFAKGPSMKISSRPPTRRIVLRGLGSALAVSPFVELFGCGNDPPANDVDAAAEAGADAGTDASVPWAIGGTAAMTDKASYPNPFAGGVTATACAATCAATLGPCYSAQSEERQDISYGYAGLPVRMSFQILDDACQPVTGASVDVWHVSAVGKYSGNDPQNENVAFCTGNDADFTSHLYFRGKQTADANGIVSFDTCYPGWYSGRTVHVHFTIRIGDTAYVTSQFVFDDALNDDILESQALYSSRGKRTTTNANDSVVSAASAADYTFETKKMTDGALLAWKSIIVRGSTSTTLCAVAGGSGGGLGGPPPGT